MGDENETNQPEQPAGPSIEDLAKKLEAAQAQFATMQGQNNLLAQQNAQLLEAVAAGAQRLPVPPAEDPTADLDPALVKALQATVNGALTPFQKQLQDMQSVLGDTRFSTQRAGIQAQLDKLKDPAVTARVDDLLTTWKSHPVFRHASPEDAFKIALGEKSMGKLGPGSEDQSQEERRGFNSPATILPGAGGRSTGKQAAPKAEAFADQLAKVDLNTISFAELQRINKQTDEHFPNGIPIQG